MNTPEGDRLAGSSAASEVPAPVVVRSYFAQWKRRSTGRWSRIHWFRQGVPVCGVVEPTDDEAAFFLPPEPLLTCVACQRINREVMSA